MRLFAAKSEYWGLEGSGGCAHGLQCQSIKRVGVADNQIRIHYNHAYLYEINF